MNQDTKQNKKQYNYDKMAKRNLQQKPRTKMWTYLETWRTNHEFW